MAATSVPTVYISVPKYVDISTIKNLPKIRPAPSTPCQPMVKSISVMDKNMCNEDSNSSMPKCKKRRLDHLTWEEKIQRKKLKNRVAAQTSRDRKKARMEEMEYEIQSLTEKAEILEKKCDGLQSINDALLEKNRKLDEQVEALREQLSELQQAQIQLKRNKLDISKETVKCSGCETILNGSAVSNGTDPLQQGSTIQIVSHTRKQQLKENSTLAALWKIVALCLLYKTCSSSMKSSTQGNSKSWPKVFLPISQQTWKEVIERSTKLLPKLQAQQSDCLDKWWGPKQNAWNPANIATNSQEMVA